MFQNLLAYEITITWKSYYIKTKPGMEVAGEDGCRATSWPRCNDPGCGRSSLDSPLFSACLDAWVPVSPRVLPVPARTASRPCCTGPVCGRRLLDSSLSAACLDA